jgi:hypothetical protein
MWLSSCLCAAALVLASAAVADAARFQISYDGTDQLSWSATAPWADCGGGRVGTGVQTVRFIDHRPLSVRIAIASFPGGRGLVFGHGHGGVSIPGLSNITRTDDTTGYYANGTCQPIPPKDCGIQPLDGFDPSIFAEPGNRLALEAMYWDSAPPFQNCMALETPVPLLNSGALYNGWVFGDQLLFKYAGPTLTTRPVSPQSLRVGRTYHFRAHKVFSLSDSDLHGFVIDSNGGLGDGSLPQEESPGNMLGGNRSIVDNVNWEIVLKRVS